MATPNCKSLENAALLFVQKDEKMGFREHVAVSAVTLLAELNNYPPSTTQQMLYTSIRSEIM